MSRIAAFLRNCDLMKGRKAAPVGTLSKDNKRRKAADGTWKPIKKRKTTMTVERVELGTGKVISTEEKPLPRFARTTQREQDAKTKPKGRRIPISGKGKMQPATPTPAKSKGRDYEGIAPEYHKYVDKAKDNIKQIKAAMKANPTERQWKVDLRRAEASLPKVIEMSRQLTQTVAGERAKAELWLKQNKLKVGDKVKVKVGTHLTFGDQFGIGTVKVNKEGQPYFAVSANQSPDGKSKRLSTNNAWEKAKASAVPIRQKDPVPVDARLAFNWLNGQLDSGKLGKKGLIKLEANSQGNIVVKQGRLKQMVKTDGVSYTDMKTKLLTAAMMLVQIRMQER